MAFMYGVMFSALIVVFSLWKFRIQIISLFNSEKLVAKENFLCESEWQRNKLDVGLGWAERKSNALASNGPVVRTR